MKKKILILFPNPFTEFNYSKFEIPKLENECKVKVIIHDLSKLVLKERFNQEWKTKIEKKALKFNSLFKWVKSFLSKKNENLLVINFIKVTNFNSFLINLFVKISNHTIIIHSPASIFRSVKPFKKNLNFFYKRINQHKLNMKVYFFSFQKLFFNFIISKLSSPKTIILSSNFKKIAFNHKDINKEKLLKVNFNSYDYSNSLVYFKKKSFKSRYILYIDNGAPYFTGDAYFKGDSTAYFGNIEKQYNDLNNFFNKLEKTFKAKVVVIPHPKYKSYSKKIKSLNPFFNNRKINNDYNALPQLTPNCLFFIQKHSTAIAFPIFFNRPVMLIYSSQQKYAREEIDSLFYLGKSIGHKPIDIMNFNKKKISQSLKINKKKYEKFKYDFLTPINKSIINTPNYKILNELTNLN